MKRILTIALTVIILAGLAGPLIGCGSESDEAETAENQIATVKRGDITVDITAAGNLALARTEDLAIDLFYQEGTVEEVMVEDGDTVTEGQALVRLDAQEWEDELEKLQDNLTGAERQVTAKNRALVQAERKVIDAERTAADKKDAVATAERQVTSKELAVSQAQLILDTAEYNLGEIDEVKEAQDAVDEAEDNLRLIRMVLRGQLGGGLGDYQYWIDMKALAEKALDDAEEELQEVLEDINTKISEDVALDVAEKQLLVKQKKLALEDAQIDVDDAKKAVADAEYDLQEAQLDVEEAKNDVEEAQLDVKDAEKELLDAQEKLEEANSKSPVIEAPFNGFITKVNVEGGDEVLTGTVAVQLADPNKFEADIMVSEMDILQVKLGGKAWVQVDALSGLTLPAEVIHISPTSTIQSGVVNYEVKVEVKSLEAMMQEQQAAIKDISSGEMPERLKEAIESGQVTQEQAEEMMGQMQQGQGWQQRQASTAISEDFQLREGLTVTVTIMVAERTDVLLVPNNAVNLRGKEAYVQVINDDVTEERVIEAGLSDWQFTEVISGLSEGEQVVVPRGTATTSTTQSSGPRGGTMMFGPPPR